MKKVAISAAILSAAFLVAGCGGGGDGASVSDSELVGRWALTKSEVKGTYSFTREDSVTDGSIDTVINHPANTYYVDLRADHTFSAAYPPLEMIFLLQLFGGLGGGFGLPQKVAAAGATGTWSVEGDVLTTISSTEDTLVFVTSISGNTGTFLQAFDMKSESGIIYETDIDAVHSATKD